MVPIVRLINKSIGTEYVAHILYTKPSQICIPNCEPGGIGIDFKISVPIIQNLFVSCQPEILYITNVYDLIENLSECYNNHMSL